MNTTEFCLKNNISIIAEKIKPITYHCTLMLENRRLSAGWSGYRQPMPDDILDVMAVKAACIEYNRSIQAFCKDMGYDFASKKAERLYIEFQIERRKLLTFLGNALYKELVFNIQRI